MKPDYDKLQSVGCIPCLLIGYPGQPCDLHHPLSGGRRIHKHNVVGGCEWHHRGIWNTRFPSLAEAENHLGPSLAINPKAYRRRFGTDLEMQLKASIELGKS